MGLLSNLLRFNTPPPQPLVIRVARGDEVEAALRLILAPAGTSAADARGVADFVAFAGDRGIAFEGLHVAERGGGVGGGGGKLVSAVLPIVSPGHTMLLLLPVGQGRAVDTATGELLEAVCRYGAARDVHLAQALVDPADGNVVLTLRERGFERMAELYYLQCHVAADAAAPALPEGMEWVEYSAANHGEFARAILESYHDSLDCPALNGRREIEDVIAGHKASGAFDPGMWFLLREQGETLGVLLLSESHRSDAVELVYLGLAPAARGRKLGELMVRQALATVARWRHARLCLAVDSANAPALKLYYRHGMQRVSAKVAMLRELRG